MQDVLFTPQKGRSAPNSLEESRAEEGQASQTATLKAAAAAMVPKRVCVVAYYIHQICCGTDAGPVQQCRVRIISTTYLL